MDAILILAIIAIQFALIHFGVKYLSLLNNKIIELNNKIEELIPLIKPNLEKTRKTLRTINNLMKKYLENENKIKIIKLLLLLNSLIATIILYRKKKNIFNIYSLYDIITKTTKALLGF